LEFSSLKGFKDILPEEVGEWQQLEAAARRRFEVFGFQEIKTPILEKTELFSRGIGQDTDIVSKEMYSFADVKGRGMTMRPEATASVVRAYIQHRLYENYPVQKLYSIGPMFRHERPQKGRFRQFHQINAELFADPGPRSDAEIILLAMGLFEAIGLSDISLHLNSLGCARCRSPFREALQAYLIDKTASLCEDCKRRSQTNPLRVFDCKMDPCKAVIGDAPSIMEFLCQACQDHFDAVKGYLTQLDLPFVLNPRLVRGLDYYNRTTFEIQTQHLGAQNAVAGGGRYDGLVKLLGGPDHPAIGFAVGMERVTALLEAGGRPESTIPDLFIAALGPRADQASFAWAEDLRRRGFWVEMDYGRKGLKSQMKKAGRLNVEKVLIVGDHEMNAGEGILRDMNKKDQIKVPLDQLTQTLARDHLK